MEAINAKLYEIDLKNVISQFSSSELKDLFGEYWHCNFLNKNENYQNVTEVYGFLSNIVNKKNEYLIIKLVNILLLMGKDLTALQIDPKYIDLVDLTRCDPRNGYFDKFSFGEENPKDLIEVKISRGFKTNAYPMNEDPRGFCFLLNNYFTKGTYKEMQRFRNIFHQLNFDVIMRKNLDAFDISKDLLLLSKSDKLKSHNAFIFMSITHGNSNGEILGFDGQTVKTENLFEMFNNANCPPLQGKPRMFFFNCCRGSNRDYGVPENLADHCLKIDSDTPKMATLSDVFICYSTLQGLVAQVDMNEGTLFGKALADSFVEKANYKSLNDIITEASKKLIEMDKQSPQSNQQNEPVISLKQPIESISKGPSGVVYFREVE